MEQKPSVGRVVHYRSYGSPGGEFKSESRAAIITAVHPAQVNIAEVVSLAILNPTGMFFNQGVLYDADGAPGTWRWPPRV